MSTGSNKNAWYELKFSKGLIGDYYNDLNIAKECAITSGNIVSLISYSAMLYTIADQSNNITPGFVLAFLFHNIWSVQNAISFALTKHSHFDRLLLLVNLMPYITLDEKESLLKEVIYFSSEMHNFQYRRIIKKIIENEYCNHAMLVCLFKDFKVDKYSFVIAIYMINKLSEYGMTDEVAYMISLYESYEEKV